MAKRPPTRKPTPAIDRIRKRGLADPLTGCINYQRDPNANPNSKLALYTKENGKTESILRIVWNATHPERPVQSMEQVRRKCLNRLCVNPEHMYLVNTPYTDPQARLF